MTIHGSSALKSYDRICNSCRMKIPSLFFVLAYSSLPHDFRCEIEFPTLCSSEMNLSRRMMEFVVCDGHPGGTLMSTPLMSTPLLLRSDQCRLVGTSSLSGVDVGLALIRIETILSYQMLLKQAGLVINPLRPVLFA